MQKIVLASGNRGKLDELRAMLEPLHLDVLPQHDFEVPEAEETGLTFVENALLKARNAAAHTGLPALADDSGLAVDALHGAPGIYSARYAGTQGDDAANNEKLLTELAGIDDANRSAQFHCCLVFLRSPNDPAPIISHGIWPGQILHAPQGDAGFGYDPLFWVASENASAAQLSKANKNSISHRGQAMRSLLSNLREQLRQQA